MTSKTLTLAEGNRWQRAYARWAQPYYERMDPALRERAEAIDRFVYTRRGITLWIGWLCGLAGTAVGLHRSGGMPVAVAVALSALLWFGVSLGALAAWLKPDAMLRARSRWRVAGTMFIAVVIGGGGGFAVGHWVRNGRLDLDALAAHAVDRLNVLAPAVALAGAGLLIVFWTLARWSDQVNRARLERRLLQAERDAASRSATEAQLRLLQGQIQPHFIFNTLATLQHWVDRHDDRAGPLLHELTGFLRRSTEMLNRSTVTLAEEVQAVRHYLAIFQARLGDRLQVHVEIDAALAHRELPPGMLLTLVENAIEHGLEPRIGGGQLWLLAQPLTDGWRLVVEDDGLGLHGHASDGVGLANLRQRLQHHFGSVATFTLGPRTGGGTRAELRWDEAARP